MVNGIEFVQSEPRGSGEQRGVDRLMSGLQAFSVAKQRASARADQMQLVREQRETEMAYQRAGAEAQRLRAVGLNETDALLQDFTPDQLALIPEMTASDAKDFVDGILMQKAQARLNEEAQRAREDAQYMMDTGQIDPETGAILLSENNPRSLVAKVRTARNEVKKERVAQLTRADLGDRVSRGFQALEVAGFMTPFARAELWALQEEVEGARNPDPGAIREKLAEIISDSVLAATASESALFQSQALQRAQAITRGQADPQAREAQRPGFLSRFLGSKARGKEYVKGQPQGAPEQTATAPEPAGPPMTGGLTREQMQGRYSVQDQMRDAQGDPNEALRSQAHLNSGVTGEPLKRLGDEERNAVLRSMRGLRENGREEGGKPRLRDRTLPERKPVPQPDPPEEAERKKKVDDEPEKRGEKPSEKDREVEETAAGQAGGNRKLKRLERAKKYRSRKKKARRKGKGSTDAGR